MSEEQRMGREDAGDSADAGATEIRGYGAADAAHTVEDFVEERLGVQAFAQWLRGYPYGANGPQPNEVEDEINRATLAVRALQQGTRDWRQVRQELIDVRRRLSGIAWHESPKEGLSPKFSA